MPWPLHTREGTQTEGGHRYQGPGISHGDHRASSLLLDTLHCDRDRGITLLPERRRRRVIHLHDL